MISFGSLPGEKFFFFWAIHNRGDHADAVHREPGPLPADDGEQPARVPPAEGGGRGERGDAGVRDGTGEGAARVGGGGGDLQEGFLFPGGVVRLASERSAAAGGAVGAQHGGVSPAREAGPVATVQIGGGGEAGGGAVCRGIRPDLG